MGPIWAGSKFSIFFEIGQGTDFYEIGPVGIGQGRVFYEIGQFKIGQGRAFSEIGLDRTRFPLNIFKAGLARG